MYKGSFERTEHSQGEAMFVFFGHKCIYINFVLKRPLKVEFLYRKELKNEAQAFKFVVTRVKKPNEMKPF